MQVAREDVNELFTEMGFEVVDKMSENRLRSRIKLLPELDDPEEPLAAKIKSPEGRMLLEELKAAVANEEEIEFTAAEKAAGNGKHPEPKAEKPAKAAKAPKAEKPARAAKAEKPAKAPKAAKAPKEKKEKAATDKFGNRVGSRLAKINAVLSRKAKTMGELVAEAEVDRTAYNHLNKLVKAGKVEKTEDGKYKLA